jgi:hypothetical protein
VVIEKNTQVFINSYIPQNKNWFRITYKNISGWANGDYLIHLNEKKETIKGFKLFIKYLFPRDSLLGNFFGIILDLLISVVTTIIVYKIRNESLDMITEVTPFIWFILRTGLFFELNPFYQLGGFILAASIYTVTMGEIAKKIIKSF